MACTNLAATKLRSSDKITRYGAVRWGGGGGGGEERDEQNKQKLKTPVHGVIKD